MDRHAATPAGRYTSAGPLLGMGILGVVFLAVVLLQTWCWTCRHIDDTAGRQAHLAVEFGKSLRNYIGKYVRPEMEKRVNPGEFILEAMSTSFVARSVLEDVRAAFPDTILRFASRNPRNPINQAAPAEESLIRYFEQHPDKDVWSGTMAFSEGGPQYFVCATPRRFEASCLKCHGRPDEAPVALLARYGTVAGFGRSVGEISVDLAAIPVSASYAAAWTQVTRHMLMALGLCLLFLVGIAFLIGADTRRRRSAEHAVEQERNLLRLVIDAMPGFVCVKSQEGRFVVANAALAQAYGATVPEVEGRCDGDVSPTPEQVEQRRRDDLEVIATRKAKHIPGEPITYADGTTHWLTTTKVPLIQEDGRCDRLLAVATDITERRQMEEALRVSEEKFRVLFEVSGDAIMTLAPPAWKFTSGNPAAVKMFQARDEAEFVTKGPWELSPEFQSDGTRSDDKAKAMIARAMQAGSHFFEWDHRRLEGEVFPATVLLTRVTLRDKVFLQATVRDNTEAKKAAALLRTSEAEYRSLFENMRDGFACCEMLFENGRPQDFTYLKVNDAFEKLTGLQNVIGKKVTEVIPGIGTSHPELFEIYGRVALTGQPESFETHLDGIGWLSISVYSLKKGYFVAVFDNITERKTAEERIRADSQVQSALNGLLSLSLDEGTTEDVLQQAIDHLTSLPWSTLSKGGIFLADDEQKTLAMAAQRGLPESVLAGCARVPFGECLCGQAASSGQIEFAGRVDERHEHTFAGICPHGHYVVPILSAGKVLGVINLYVQEGHVRSRKEEEFLQAAAVVLAGMIQRKRVDQKQVELLERLAGINQELQDFAYVVSHDLKAPLRAIRTLADWLVTDYQDKLDAQGRENLQLLGSRVDRMHNLIDGVLQYSRVGRTEQDRKPVDLGQLLPQIVADLGVPAHIVIRVQSALPTVEADLTRITQVFQNLLSNAIKYNDKPEGRIAVAYAEEGGFWKFSISDNGPGIERKDFERVFKLFQTLGRHRDGESTGIGLTITKKIVEMYGGKIWVESEVGQGSTFFFTFPQRQVPGRQPPTAAHDESRMVLVSGASPG